MLYLNCDISVQGETKKDILESLVMFKPMKMGILSFRENEYALKPFFFQTTQNLTLITLFSVEPSWHKDKHFPLNYHMSGLYNADYKDACSSLHMM